MLGYIFLIRIYRPHLRLDYDANAKNVALPSQE